MKLKVYAAGPIAGLSGEQVFEHFEYVSAYLKDCGFDVIHPMIGKDELKIEGEFKSSGYFQNPLTTDHSIFKRDMWGVQHSDIILADLTLGSNKVSIGTMMELAWGSMLGKLVIVILPQPNIHNHAFVYEAASVVYPTLDEALSYLALYNKTK